ncbi:hypothetical protein BgiBS90_036147 [Biomphalaria glabrata]|nr:hypothetical protein BgiBS90_036147 [Biomphalaria glabrata]
MMSSEKQHPASPNSRTQQVPGNEEERKDLMSRSTWGGELFDGSSLFTEKKNVNKLLSLDSLISNIDACLFGHPLKVTTSVYQDFCVILNPLTKELLGDSFHYLLSHD